MAYKEIDVKEFEKWIIHFTPIENKVLIENHGLLLPTKARKINGHVSHIKNLNLQKT